MEQKQIKMLIVGVIIVGILGLLLNLGIRIYSQNQAAQLEKDSLAQWKEQSLHEYLRKVEKRLQKLEWEQMQIQNDLGGLKGIKPPDDVVDNSTPGRHYFQKCQGTNFDKVKKGMSKQDIRALCGGHEYPAFETVRNGFCFALNDARTSFYAFSGWMPNMSVSYDFFVSDQESILYVRYDQQGIAQVIEQYPIAQDKKLSGQQAGVEIKRTDKTLEMIVTPQAN